MKQSSLKMDHSHDQLHRNNPLSASSNPSSSSQSSLNTSALPSQEHHHEHFVQPPPFLGSLQNQQQTLITQNLLDSFKGESSFSEFLQPEEEEEPSRTLPLLESFKGESVFSTFLEPEEQEESSRTLPLLDTLMEKPAQQELSLTPTPPISKVYRWVDEKPATVPTLEYLMENGFKKVAGDVQCKKCHYNLEYKFDLEQKFNQILEFTQNNIQKMNSSEPPMGKIALLQLWSDTILPTCSHCQKYDCLKPVTPDSKDTINWLFLFLGGMLHLCKKSELEYCCHQYQIGCRGSGTKDYLLRVTYCGLCRKLDPNVEFGR